jgi:hypothetical protein
MFLYSLKGACSNTERIAPDGPASHSILHAPFEVAEEAYFVVERRVFITDGSDGFVIRLDQRAGRHGDRQECEEGGRKIVR